jgi:uncharacterized protein (TIGR02001 family)
MKRLTQVFVALAACRGAPLAAAPPAPGAAGLSAYVTLTTDYRDRGLSQSDGEPALQAGVDYQHGSGFFTGIWGSTVEYEVEAGRRHPRENVIELYAGYNWRNERWSVTAAAARYVYPDISVDYDYDEVAAGLAYRDHLFLTVSYTDALLSLGPSRLDAELTLAVPLPAGVELGGTIGRVDSEAFSGGGYAHWNLGASRALGPLSLDLRFYDNDAPRYGYYGAALPDSWVLSLSYGFRRR